MRHRPAWRQRLVEAERGITHGFRGDSILFVHGFLASVTVAAALVLGLSLVQWSVLVLAVTLVLSAELFNQVLRTLLRDAPLFDLDTVQRALRIATAAVFLTMTGAALAIGLVFAQRLWQVFAG